MKLWGKSAFRGARSKEPFFDSTPFASPYPFFFFKDGDFSGIAFNIYYDIPESVDAQRRKSSQASCHYTVCGGRRRRRSAPKRRKKERRYLKSPERSIWSEGQSWIMCFSTPRLHSFLVLFFSGRDCGGLGKARLIYPMQGSFPSLQHLSSCLLLRNSSAAPKLNFVHSFLLPHHIVRRPPCVVNSRVIMRNCIFHAHSLHFLLYPSHSETLSSEPCRVPKRSP